MTVNKNESLIRKKWQGYGQAFAILFAVVVYTAFVVIERESFAFGERLEDAATKIAVSVSAAGNLTPACTELAAQLTEETLKSRLGSGQYLKEVLETYVAWPCPQSALPGISFGVSEAIRSAYRGA
ncbi:hypothetical protein [Roseibium sp. RKSG952]|uniref:hypothetical protein n=1 Tax=Roseibium sp. RKSG952 TaxID=2529384 RepID=UPI0012BBE9C9|nr:hypothetical protein [Roseibium sp. RKSG952]MTH96625.1 hypothetical protein [Roseibium sp. RKSG952]